MRFLRDMRSPPHSCRTLSRLSHALVSLFNYSSIAPPLLFHYSLLAFPYAYWLYTRAFSLLLNSLMGCRLHLSMADLLIMLWRSISPYSL